MDLYFTSILFLLFCTPLSSHGKQILAGRGGQYGVLSNYKLTHDWNDLRYTLCPRNEYVIGVSIRTSMIPYTGVSIISAIRMKCSDRIRGSSIAPPLHLGKYDTTTSDWQTAKECPRGFVTGIFLYMIPRPKILGDDDSTEVDTGNYVRGLEFLCQDDRHSSNLTALVTTFPSSVQFGEMIGSKEGLKCSPGQVLIGVGVQKYKSVITMDEGENLFPADLLIDCVRPTHPLVRCWIELEFERVPNFNCSPYVERDYSLAALMENSTLGTDADNITCRFSSLTGAKLNSDITNLDDIILAYESSGITNTSGYQMDYFLFLKMAEPEFHQEWHDVVGENEPPCDPEMMWKHFSELSDYNQTFTLNDASPRKTLTFGNLALFRSRNKARDQEEDIQLTHSVKMEQLVGYCGVLKLYFPFVRKEVTSFIREKIGKTDTIYEFV